MQLRVVLPALVAAALLGGTALAASPSPAAGPVPAPAPTPPVPEDVKEVVRAVVDRIGEPEVPEPRDVVHGVLGESGVETVRYYGRCVRYGEC